MPRPARPPVFQAQAVLERTAHVFKEEQLLENKKQREARAIEQAKDTAEFEALLARRRQLLTQAYEHMGHLNCPPGYRDDYEEKHNEQLGSPDTVTDRQIRALKVDLEDLELSISKLEERCSTDGIFVALRHTMSANVWKPKMLAQMIVKGPGALKIDNLGGDEIDYQQLLTFLQRKEIKHTLEAMAFFLEKVGSSKKKVDGGKTRLDVNKFTKAFDTVVTPPLPT